MTDPNKPVLIELDDEPGLNPASAPPVPEAATPPRGSAMQTAAGFAARRRSRLARWFWGLAGGLAAFGLSVWAWDTVTGLIAGRPTLGYVALGLVAAFLLVCLVGALREWAAFARLRRLDRVRQAAEAAIARADLKETNTVVDRMLALYHGREELEWSRQRLAERRAEQFDADALLGLAEMELLAPLDAAARAEVEAAARQVAAITAIVPLALADVAAALIGNLRMIRRIAEIYGGRAGTLGSWRLTRTVLGHLVATGAVAVGDDLLGSVAGGGLLSKVSRRFGEGVVNGALTARVGIAAIEVCRPLPFGHAPRPTVSDIVKRALTGLFTGR